jgi:hypothetical protein
MTETSIRPDLYISADVETDGSVPGPFSLLSQSLLRTYPLAYLSSQNLG